jgi:hypothetical protein
MHRHCFDVKSSLFNQLKRTAVLIPPLLNQSCRRFQASKPTSLWSNQLSEEARQSSPVQGNKKSLFRGPETSESKLFALGSSLATRLTTDRDIECTELNEKGDIVIGHGHIKKSDLVRKVSNPSYQ